jgi:integrase
MIVVLWRAGLRIHEALALAETDLEERRGAMLVRHSKGDRRREIGMDDWGWEQLRPWVISTSHDARRDALLRGRGSFSRAAVDGERRSLSAAAARRRGRRAPSLCPSPAASRSCDRDGPRGRSLNIIQRQLGHTDLGVTSTYLQGIDNAEIVNAVHARRAPMMPASAGLRL